MTTPTRIAKNLAVAGAITVGAELAAAVLWPAPDQPEFDPSVVIPNGSTTLRLAALGDSTITAPGVEDPDEIWVREVAYRLADRLRRTVALQSFAVGGATTGDVAAGQVTGAVAFAPHLTLVSVGANDIIRGVPMRRLTANLDTIVSQLTASGSRVVTSGVGDLGSIPRLAPPLRQMATRLGRRADRVHSVVTEAYGATKVEQWGWANEQFRTRRDIWSADRFHPNANGHVIWAEACWETLDRLELRHL